MGEERPDFVMGLQEEWKQPSNIFITIVQKEWTQLKLRSNATAISHEVTLASSDLMSQQPVEVAA